MTSVTGRAPTATGLWCMSAAELADAIRSRRVSSREVIEAHLRRIEAVNPLINAVTVVVGEQALQAAKAADDAAARREDLPPLHGVPFTVKENIDVAGTATTQGARALADAYPSRDAPVVERLKGAGPSRSAAPTFPPTGSAGSVRASCAERPWILTDAGYAVDEIEPPSIELAAKTALEMLATDLQVGWELMSSYPPLTKGVLAALIEVVGHPDQARAVLAWMTRQSVLRAWGEFQEEHPLIVAPIFTGVPFEAGKGYTTAEVAEIVHGLRITVALNALGLPAVALPVGIGEGLPQAVQVIGPRYREDLCLDAAAAIEERTGIITPIDPRLWGNELVSPADH